MSVASQNAYNVKELLKKYRWRYVLTATSMGQYLALQFADTRYKPDVVIAGMPFYHTQKEGHAASDEILKYRSMGTLFLAHQKGGKRTYKCTFKVQGPARLIVLGFLQALQRRGVQENMTLSKAFPNRIPDFTDEDIGKDEFIPPTANSKIRYILKYEDLGEEQIAFHKTIPIITDTKIYTNMYLETLRYTEDIKIGINTMEIDCAFREFIPPLHVQWYKGNKSKKKKDNKKGYFSTWVSDEERDSLRRMDLLLNGLWALRGTLDEAINKQMEDKQIGQYAIEASVLAVGSLLAQMTIWSK